ncbi:50S ribosomal protein L31, partial [Patescibacteria group bacterium]|nr:50S ribosomal protein L31 [Patescibacteria group bacterium]
MKKDIHPTYYPKAKITCACGNVIETGSTLENFSTEVCSACHPLYTG